MSSEFLFLHILTLQGITYTKAQKSEVASPRCTVKSTASILAQQCSWTTYWTTRQASLLEAVGRTSDFLEQSCLMDSLQVSV